MSFKITGKDFHKDGREIHDLSKVVVPEDVQQEVMRIFHADRLEVEIAKNKQRTTHKEEVR